MLVYFSLTNVAELTSWKHGTRSSDAIKDQNWSKSPAGITVAQGVMDCGLAKIVIS
jgi:hypothetical protein